MCTRMVARARSRASAILLLYIIESMSQLGAFVFLALLRSSALAAHGGGMTVVPIDASIRPADAKAVAGTCFTPGTETLPSLPCSLPGKQKSWICRHI